ncbi:hypothetical protein ACLOJK_041890 [Asimina triloba]
MSAPIEQNSLAASAGDCNFPQAIQLLSSLISASHSTKVFNGKWQLIRNKLELLSSILASVAESCTTYQETELSPVIQPILTTATECRDLARRCTELSYSGKLLMQSDLDIVVVKFEYAIKDLNEIYTRAHAIVVSRPGPAASSADVKFYVGELATRMKIGNWETKREALLDLNGFLQEDESNVRVVVEMGEIVRLLVEFLEFAEPEAQEESTKPVLVLAGYDSCTSALVGAGVLAPLIHVLEIGSDGAKERAAMALRKLTENFDCAWLVSAHGGIAVLLKLCNCDSNWQLVSLACGVLRNLASIEDVKRLVIKEGLVSAIVRLSRSEDEVTQIGAIEFLQEIASGDDHVRKIIVHEGGIQALIEVFGTKSSSHSSKSQEAALSTLDSLYLCTPSSVNALIGSEFLNSVLFFIQGGEASVQEIALKMAYRLCVASNDAKKAMGELGFMQELVRFLGEKSLPIREMAAEALSHMISIPKNRKKFLEDDSNVAHVTELLDSREEKTDQEKNLLSSLTKALIHRKKPKITASGIVDYLERLAVAEVTDAKRIVKKISEHRFRKMLTGIGIWGTKM